ncbi:Na(+)/H(+) antiporter subunit F1 [Mangrovibacillus cuniculi]|uniref:Na(+)/H(+) antiporter subunit F1 n=1 Tax=Mangrovibacillus cuniculi TaxID=2593652 RepID=A0A7S8CCB5_9BACI|nr:Na(+)/H(+) antiporter subunit F1 [Mangrovibacillus cuniculi]QPC47349.1 Na(+)/H(+) antiporter subunit F1 [Mangrovibacillus cuniculi]
MTGVFMGALIVLTISIMMLVIRVVKGPTTPDRVVALDAIGVLLIAIIAVLSMLLSTYAFLDVIILLAILAFIGTVAFAKFIERGVIIQHDRNK